MELDIKIFEELLRLKNFIKSVSPNYDVVIRHTTSGYFNFDFFWKDLKEKSFKVELLDDVERCKYYSFQRIGESY
jgi:hypothetical protein